MELIASTVLTGTATSVTFSSIPQTFRDLVLVVNARKSNNNSTDLLGIRLNGQTTSTSYYVVSMEGTGSSATYYAQNADYFWSSLNTNNMSGDTNTLATFHVFDYSTTNKFKPLLCRSNNASLGTMATSGRNAVTTAITSLEVDTYADSFQSGGTFYLYGIPA